MSRARAQPELGAFVDKHLDLPLWRQEWRRATAGSTTVWPYANIRPVQANFAMAVGTSVDNRLGWLVRLDPLPRTIPDPPPWNCRDPYAALPADSTLTGSPVWEAVMVDDAVGLTETSLRVLFPRFAGTPVSERHAHVPIDKNVALHGGISVADLVVGRDLVEVKTYKEYEGPEGQKNSLAAARQLGHLVLSDRYDHFRTRHALVWLARQGVTVELPVEKLFVGLRDVVGLSALREQYRRLRCTWEWENLMAVCGGDPALSATAYFHCYKASVPTHAAIAELLMRPSLDLDAAVQTMRSALKCWDLEVVLDAIRGWQVEVSRGLATPVQIEVRDLLDPYTWDGVSSLGTLLSCGRLEELAQVARDLSVAA